MPPKLKLFLQRWVINTLAVALAANMVGGITYDNGTGLFLAALLLGILNTFLRPVLMLLALPLLLATLGLFMLVINALLLLLVGNLLASFHVRDFAAAFWGALVIGLVSFTLNTLLGTGDGKFRFRVSSSNRKNRPPNGGNNNGSGGGPVIDV